MSIIQGIRANRQAKKIAGGIERRGEQDAQLRRFQAEELFAAIRQRAPDSGVDASSQTALDLEKQAAHFEDIDIGRIRFKAAVEAHQARLEGQAQLATSIGDTVGLVMNSVNLGLLGARLDAANTVAGSPVTIDTPPSTFDPTIGFGTPSLNAFEFTTPGILGVNAPNRPTLNTVLNVDTRIRRFR